MKKKKSSFLSKAIDNKNNFNTFEFVFIVIFAFILDTLRILLKSIGVLLCIGLVAGLIGGGIAYTKLKPYYDEYELFARKVVVESNNSTFRGMENSYIYDSNNNIIAKLRSDKDTNWLEYDEIPTDAINAFIAVEDRTFWDNPGYDIKGIIRVGLQAVKTKGDEVHGASTITQQLARNIFLTHEVSLERKAKEILIAKELTYKYSKKQIIEYYVNDICFANSFYGLEAAANGYFNKKSSELTLSQIAYLCAIPNRPEYYNPYKYPDRALERRDKILGDMYELGYITRTEYTKAKYETIKLEKPDYEFKDYQSTFAIDCAVRYLMEDNGFNFVYNFTTMDEYNTYKNNYNVAYENARNQLYSGGYNVYTTLDSDIQQEMQEVLDEQLSFEEDTDEETGIYKLQGAITVVDNKTGKVIALIGGRSQDNTDKVYSLNRAYQSYRQPGSSIKPLVVYTPALMSGYTPNTTVYNISVSEAKQKGVDVQSLTGEAMTLRSALERSKNGVAWQIFDKLGADYCMSFLNKMKFSSICPNDYFNSSSLGGLTYGVTTVEMAGAYSTLVNHGVYREPTCIKEIINKNGVNIYGDEIDIQVYDSKQADKMVDMMTGVIKQGTAAKLNWYKSTDMIAACKTGTTNDSKDGWLCGFTPYYTVTVWVGYDTPKTLSNLYGATYPGQIWKSAMLKLIQDKEVITEFEKSDDYYELSYEHNPDLPESAYEKYLPGRSDEEQLADGYTVFDYRKDRVIGEGVTSIVNQMYSIDRNDIGYTINLSNLYTNGCQIIATLYSSSYKDEMQKWLDDVYVSCYNEIYLPKETEAN